MSSRLAFAAVAVLVPAAVARADPPGLVAPTAPSPRRFEIAIDPISPRFGYWEGAIDCAISRQVVLSLSAAYWTSDPLNGGAQIVASVPIYLSRAYSGVFVEPGMVLRGYSHVYPGAPANFVDPDPPWMGPELLVGWQVTSASGLAIAAAFGLVKPLSTRDSSQKPLDDPEINGYFRVGYVF
ncbi:MAG TPA: hypothetical protein VMJ10_37325 [Kofleriaceae bacterium]|nr:hypothetical protein [Kofleriaceae bacterium]